MLATKILPHRDVEKQFDEKYTVFYDFDWVEDYKVVLFRILEKHSVSLVWRRVIILQQFHVCPRLEHVTSNFHLWWRTKPPRTGNLFNTWCMITKESWPAGREYLGYTIQCPTKIRYWNTIEMELRTDKNWCPLHNWNTSVPVFILSR